MNNNEMLEFLANLEEPLSAQDAISLIGKSSGLTVDTLTEVLTHVPYSSVNQASEGVSTFFYSGSIGEIGSGPLQNANSQTLLNIMEATLDEESLAHYNSGNTSQAFQVANS